MGYRVGEQAGPYEVLQLLGRGTFAEVLLACDVRCPQHKVALKTVVCDQLSGGMAEKAQRAAVEEAQLLLRLRHPHIVCCEEVQWDEARRTMWLALEFMDGGDAQGLIDRRREAGGPAFGAHFVRRALAAVGSALRYCHAEGVLHRDVKPANVLITRRSQRMKLGDFGIAKLLEATSRAKSVVGTPYYLSPEIVSGQAYGQASDAWALGVFLYELAALRRPFEAANALALVRRICEEPPIELPAGTAGDVHKAIIGLLERDLDQRLTIEEALAVSDAVAALAAGGPDDVSQSHAGGELSPVSAVSLAVSESCGCSSASEEEADIVASLCGMGTDGPSGVLAAAAMSTNTPVAAAGAVPTPLPSDAATMPGPSAAAPLLLPWQESAAVLQARAALSADVDDPEELQAALHALDREAPHSQQGDGEGGGAAAGVQALREELQLRLEALKADATSMLQTLLGELADNPPLASAIEAREGAVHDPGGSDGHDGGSRLDEEADTVTTMCGAVVGVEASTICTDAPDGVAALETAIELATSLGVDTGAAEEHATSARGLLSIRVTCGHTARFCLLPVGVPFSTVVAEVARRFGFLAPATGSPMPFSLVWRDGAEARKLHDQVSWEACLQRRGLWGRPGRLELRAEVPFGAFPAKPAQRGNTASLSVEHAVPFVVTGTRVRGVGAEAPATCASRVRAVRRGATAAIAAAAARAAVAARASMVPGPSLTQNQQPLQRFASQQLQQAPQQQVQQHVSWVGAGGGSRIMAEAATRAGGDGLHLEGRKAATPQSAATGCLAPVTGPSLVLAAPTPAQAGRRTFATKRSVSGGRRLEAA